MKETQVAQSLEDGVRVPQPAPELQRRRVNQSFQQANENNVEGS